MNKNLLIILLSFVLCLFFAGCGKTPSISLKEGNITLKVGETYEVNPTIADLEGEAQLVLTPADSTLLSIEGSKITALKVGTTTVEVSLKDYPNVKATLNVVIESAPSITVTGAQKVYVGEEIQLSATLKDLQGTITWSSSDETVASVEDGKVTGLEDGEVTITATCGEFSGSLDIVVKQKPELKITGEDIVSVGNELKLKAASKNLEEEVVWTSSDESIATVKDGVVTALKGGKVTITATSGIASDSKEITVIETKIIISGPKSVYVGEEIQLEATIENPISTAPTFEWSSSEDDVATVINGLVKATAEGTIIITVTADGVKATYEIECSLRREVIIEGDSNVDLNDTVELSVSLLNVAGDVQWSSSDETVAKVEKGVVTGLKLGKVTITATVAGVSGTFDMEVIPVSDKITYYYDGGSSKELLLAEEAKAQLTLTSYNSNSGSFWGGGYSSNIYLTTQGGDPKATFSDRIYIGKDQYTGYYTVMKILTSGPSSWQEGAEYVISISSSYSGYRDAHAQVQKISVGDIVIIGADDYTTINKENPSVVKFLSTEVKGNKVVVEKADYKGTLIEPVKLGYEFAGWYDNNGKKYETLTAEEIVGNIKLTAKWFELNPVTDITVNEIPAEMLTEDTFQINASVVPSDAFFTQILFSSSNKDVVSVTAEGLLTAVNTGIATITIEDFIGKVVKTYEITVNAKPSIDVNFADGYNGVLNVGDSLQLEPSYLGKAVDGLTFSYTSSKESVAKVDSTGKVTAVANGDAMITIKSSNDVELVIGITVTGLSEADKVDQVIKLLVENHFPEVEVGNACLYNDGTDRYYRATYGSVNRFLFDELVIDNKYSATAEANSGGHRSRRFDGNFDDSIEFVTVHDTATLTGTSESIASNMASGGTSIHYSTGNYKVWSVVPEKYIAYHAGDGTGTPFKWIPTGVKADENVAPEYDLVKEGNKYYFSLNGVKSNVEAPISNGSKTIQNPSKKNLANLGPVWKVVNGEYYIGNTWVCFSQVAAGVIGSYGGNNNSIGIEMSVNTTNDMYDTYQRTAKLVADILIRNNLDLTRVQQHNTWTGKNCPQVLIAGNYWDDFMKMVAIEYLMATEYKDVEVTIESDNPDIVDNTGRVKNAPSVHTTVGYTITVKSGSVTKSIKLYSVVPGTTSWQKWNGTYKSSLIWNDGNFVVNK